MFVCAAHFQPEDFTGKKRERVNEKAIPMIFKPYVRIN